MTPRRVAALMAERDKAVEHAKQAWSAATDDTVVGFHRDMAGRLAEDRDVQKHRAREAEAKVAELEAAVDRERGLRETNWAYQQDLITRLEAERDTWKTLAAKLAGLSGDVLPPLADDLPLSSTSSSPPPFAPSPTPTRTPPSAPSR